MFVLVAFVGHTHTQLVTLVVVVVFVVVSSIAVPVVEQHESDRHRPQHKAQQKEERVPTGAPRGLDAGHALRGGYIEVHARRHDQDGANRLVAERHGQDQHAAQHDAEARTKVGRQRLRHTQTAVVRQQGEIGNLLRNLVVNGGGHQGPGDGIAAQQKGRSQEDAVAKVVKKVAQENAGRQGNVAGVVLQW